MTTCGDQGQQHRLVKQKVDGEISFIYSTIYLNRIFL